jgi:branched-chain amino acid transport system permease protein
VNIEGFLRTFLDQTVNGLVTGNIYALIAVGIALIFGVSNLINFAQGSVFMVGAYVGWLCITQLQLPLPAAFTVVALVCGVLGMAMERLALRPLQNSARIAPLLATIGISLVLDQSVQILFSPNPHSFPNPLPAGRISIKFHVRCQR